MRQNNKLKQLSALALAVCMAASVAFSGAIPGVFAAEDNEPVPTESTSTVQEEEPAVSQAESTPESEPASEPQQEQNSEEVQGAEAGSASGDAEQPEVPAESQPGADSASSDSDHEQAEMPATTYAAEGGEEVQAAVSDWLLTTGAVTVSGNGTQPQSVSATALSAEERAAYTGEKSIVFGYNVSGTDGSVPTTLTIADCGIMSDDTSVEIWKINDAASSKVETEVSIEEGRVTFSADGWGKYIAVSNVTTVDLAKGAIAINYETISGIQQDGTEIEISFTDDVTKNYRIAQSNNGTRVENSVNVANNIAFTSCRTLILDGINTSGAVTIHASGKIALVKLQLRNMNQVHHVGYGTNANNSKSQLIIENYGEANALDGQLYIPYKMESKEEERKYIAATGEVKYWAYAGIGGNPEVGSPCFGLTIAGGTIRVITQNKNAGSAIGAGGNGDAQIKITGGDITAICSGTGAAIGGGIGWKYRGGIADISITGAKIYAENVKYRSADGVDFGGVAIGSGSSMMEYGSAAKISISDSAVTAYARYGNAIGSGNSNRGTAAEASIDISGNSIVTTNALGGGTSKAAQGGSASITVSDDAVVKCVDYSTVTNKWDTGSDNILGAFGIGGGNSAGDAKGGSAVVNVTGGTLNCLDGNIGGGDAIGTGDGGDASIYVSGGTLNCASIGGGNSVSGTPGAVTSDTQSAGVVVTGGTLNANTIGGGTIKKCTAELGGAIYMTTGTVTLSGAGSIENCTAVQGGGIYLANGTVTMNGGSIVGCASTGSTGEDTKTAQGGAIYMENGIVTANDGSIGAPPSTVNGTTVSRANTAAQGAGVYLAGGAMDISGGAVEDNTATKNGGGAYLTGGSLTVSGGTFSGNRAENGAGAYLQEGNLSLSGGGAFNNNMATQNGGGIYLASNTGSLDMTGGTFLGNQAQNGAGAYMVGGTITQTGGSFSDNTATINGGGIYMQSGILNANKGFIQNNKAVLGGGVYLAGSGNLTMRGGSIDNNTANQNGGGAYLAGGVLRLENESSITGNTAEQDGGGAYVADGNVHMFGGSIASNTATNGNGGGMYVSSNSTAAKVVVRSGKITGNESKGSGGGIAVVSANNTKDIITLGVLEDHKLDYTSRTFTAFDYKDSVDGQTHNHASCPVLQNNKATGDGGGIYMGSKAAVLNVYCLLESGNESQENANGNSVMAAGGTVVIGDKLFNEAGADGTQHDAAYGNIRIGSSMLVEGGTVDIWGNMENPDFENNILVDIKQANQDHFKDHRQQASTDSVEYKVHYFENFTNGGTQDATGLYIAKQYTAAETISAEGTMFAHEGWKIVGWDTKNDGTGTRYNIGSNIGSENNHIAWGNDDTQPLVLYAIWQRTVYTVKYEPNANSHSGSMENQTFEYDKEEELNPNAYKVTGKRFTGWNTKADSSGIAYAADYKESKMTDKDGDTVTLYAQWVDCTHNGGEHPGTLTYTVSDDGKTITETCDCGGHTATVTLSAVSVYYDGNKHPAALTYSQTALLAGKPTITYQYKAANATDSDGYGNMPEGESVPVSIGSYKASITVEDKTVSVEYQIMDATKGTDLTAKITAGQIFADFNGLESNGKPAASISQDDAFTVQFDVRNLNTDVYTTEPKLVFATALPQNTTIIMQTANNYWYLKIGADATKEIALSSFTQMGGSEKFSYNTTTIASTQNYQFIVDFSQANMSAATQSVSFTYEPDTAQGSQQLTSSVTLTTAQKKTFGLSVSGSKLTVTAPASTSTNRWNGKQLVLVLQQADKELPADAKLTASIGDTTAKYSLNERKQFVIPLDWSTKQDVNLVLSSDLASAAGQKYRLTANLYTGTNDQKLLNTGATQSDVTLTVAANTAPSLKLAGKSHVFALGETSTLDLTVTAENIDGCTLSATITKKPQQGDGYYGNFLTAEVQANQENQISLNAVNAEGAGSYRLMVTVSKNNQTLLQVPYYFIVQ